MRLLLLAMLTLEHLVVGGLLLIVRAVAMVLEVWAKSIYRRLNVLLARAK